MIDTSDIAVVVTAKSRPKYLDQVLRSWELVRGAGNVRTFTVALGRSDMVKVQIDLIENSTLRTHIRLDSKEAERSPGMHRAIGEAIDAVLQDPQVNFVVLGEEDVVVSDDILEYMTWARKEMTRDGQLLVACAHNRGGCGWDAKNRIGSDSTGYWSLREPDQNADQQAVRPLAYFNPWGWGIYRDAWFKVIRPQWDWECNSGGQTDSGYDWNMATRILPGGGWLSLVPDAARSQNIGAYGGTYSGPEIHPLQVSQSYREHRETAAAGYRLKEELDRCPACGSTKLGRERIATGELFLSCTRCTWSES